jgi:lipoyl(octanoyl) transferase
MTEVIIIDRGLEAYERTHQAMRERIELLKGGERAEIWYVQHHGVFTQGQAGKIEHLLDLGDIPLVQSDRGGQVTYHGPGQIILYTLIPLKKFGLSVRGLVKLLENTVIALLAIYGIEAKACSESPGVYVGDKKIASLGLRIRHGVSFHGIAVNVNMDLEPFSRINPCGYPGLEILQISDLIGDTQLDKVAKGLSEHLKQELLALASHRMTSKA